jgi:hypothetical protein
MHDDSVNPVHGHRHFVCGMFEWLEHAWPTNDTGVTDLLLDPFLRAYKDDPRFIAFAQKIGVMPKAAAKQ